MICKNCGSDIRNDAVFCTGCGAHVVAEPAMTADSATPGSTMPEPLTPELQPPCVSSIPLPPQMPDLPPPPELPQGEPGMQDRPLVQERPIAQGRPLVQERPGTQYIPGSQPVPYPPEQAQYNYEPAQQRYQTLPPPYAPIAPREPKKSKTGLVVGLSIGGVALIALAIFIGIVFGRVLFDSINDPWDDPDLFAIFTPQPESAPQPIPVDPDTTPDPQSNEPLPPMPAVGYELLGVWARDYGDYIWFFGTSENIRFSDKGDGTFEVYESDYKEFGSWHINSTGNLIIIGDWTGTQEFRFVVDGDRLTIIDSDGDMANYYRAS